MMELVSERDFWDLAASILAARVTRCEIAAQREDFVRWASTEGLAGLLLRAMPEGTAWDGFRAPLRQAALRQAVIATLQELELRRVLGGFALAGVSPLLLKGAALAYTIYPEAALRPRGDTDLLIAGDDEARSRRALERLGYDLEPEISGRLVTSQFHYRRSDSRGIRHACDVHLKIANAQAYANRLSYDELRSEAVRLMRLDPNALAPSAVHSLLIACVHRVAHHYDTPNLLWLFDIHLLAGSLSEAEWERTCRLSDTKQLSLVVLQELARSCEAFGCTVPEKALRRLENAASREPPPPLFGADTRTVDVVLSDFVVLPTWRARLQLLCEHLFPPRSYMRQRYARCPPALLPLTYAYRVARGAPKWFRRTR
jgi:hypothetical protein